MEVCQEPAVLNKTLDDSTKSNIMIVDSTSVNLLVETHPSSTEVEHAVSMKESRISTDKVVTTTDSTENDHDAGSEDESDADVSETESEYDSSSMRGVKDGRMGSYLTIKVRFQTRKRFLNFLRRLSKLEV